MKFQSLISRVSVVLFAAALTMTSCTKDESYTSPNGTMQASETFDKIIIDDWIVTSNTVASGVTFNDGTGSTDQGGVFSDNDGGEFTWRIVPGTNAENDQLEVSSGTTVKTYEVSDWTPGGMTLTAGAETIVLSK